MPTRPFSILIVSHSFPPNSSVGAQRPGYTASAFARWGADVQVLHGPQREHLRSDNQETSYSTFAVDRRFRLPRGTVAIGWWLAYRRALAERLSDTDIDYILLSGGPFFYFPLARWCARKTKAKVILDYRDTRFSGVSAHPTRTKKIIERLVFMRRWAVDRVSIAAADLVLGVTESESRSLRSAHEGSTRAAFRVMYNGFDDRHLPLTEAQRDPHEPDDIPFRVGLFGRFATYDQRDADTLAEVLKEHFVGKVEICQIGHAEEQLRALAADRGLQQELSFLGPMDYAEGINALAKMDAMLLNHRSSGGLGTKLFDYIGLNRPIIAMAGQRSEISRVLDEFEEAHVVSTSDELAAALHSLIDRRPALLTQRVDLMRYSRSAAVKQLFDEPRCHFG